MPRLFFQLAQLLGNRRLADVQALGGARQAAFLGHGVKDSKVVDVHAPVSSCHNLRLHEP
jgi:hypothetical protein